MINVANLSVNAASGVTNTIRAESGGLLLLHSSHIIPNSLHLLDISCCNPINGTTTIVVPPTPQNAGNMNIKLFPPPVPITPTTLDSPFMTAPIAFLCMPRNSAPSPINLLNSTSISIFLNFFHLFNRPSSLSSSNGTLFLFFFPDSSPKLDSKPKNLCHVSLTSLNLLLILSITPSLSRIPLAYIIPAICDPCPAAKSQISSSSLSFPSSSSSSSINA